MIDISSPIPDLMPHSIEWYFGTSTGKTISESINSPLLSPPQETNSRLINHWEKEEILPDQRKNGKGWRKYSCIELVWIEIILELRKFNYSLEKIRIIKKKFETDNDITDFTTMPSLEFFVINLLSKPESLLLSVESNGNSTFNFFKELAPSFIFGKLESTLLINLNIIIEKVFNPFGISLNVIPDFSLNKAEREFLLMLRTGKYKSFEIETKSDKIKMINALEVIKDETIFRKLAMEFPFQSINTDYRDSRIAHITRTVKIKF